MGDLEEEEVFRHNLAGEWELDRSENYDEFLRAIGELLRVSFECSFVDEKYLRGYGNQNHHVLVI